MSTGSTSCSSEHGEHGASCAPSRARSSKNTRSGAEYDRCTTSGDRRYDESPGTAADPDGAATRVEARDRDTISTPCSSGSIWPTPAGSGASLVEQAEKEEWSYRDFLGLLGRRGDRAASADAPRSALATGPLPLPQDHRRLRLHLPVHRAAGAARLRPLRPTSSPRDAASILLGKPGRGKTHLAVAIAYRAIQNGFDALFTTAAELIDEPLGRLPRGTPRRERSRPTLTPRSSSSTRSAT